MGRGFCRRQALRECHGGLIAGVGEGGDQAIPNVLTKALSSMQNIIVVSVSLCPWCSGSYSCGALTSIYRILISYLPPNPSLPWPWQTPLLPAYLARPTPRLNPSSSPFSFILILLLQLVFPPERNPSLSYLSNVVQIA